jgi:hypothetical protein
MKISIQKIFLCFIYEFLGIIKTHKIINIIIYCLFYIFSIKFIHFFPSLAIPDINTLGSLVCSLFNLEWFLESPQGIGFAKRK